MKRSFSSYYLSEAKFKLIELNQDRTDSEDPDEEHLKKHHGIEELTDDGYNEEQSTDPDRQGVIRTIPNAHLIYKRTTHDGTYEEMWMYKAGSNYRDENKIRSAILDGTDIDQRVGSSPDGEQSYEIWTCNDRQIMKISGLTN
jgi:hypothetical protein